MKLKKDTIIPGKKAYSDIPITVNIIDEENRVMRFIASSPAIDRVDDRVFPEGVDLVEFKKNPIFLYAHNRWEENPALGNVINSEVKEGKLYQDVKFWKSPEIDAAKWSEWDKFANMIWLMYKEGVMRAVSIGFDPVEYKWVETQNRTGYDIISWKQLELSACAIGMNPEALSEMKSKGIDAEFMKAYMTKKSLHKKSENTEPKTPKTQLEELKELEEVLDRVTPKLEKYNQLIGKSQAKDNSEKEESNVPEEVPEKGDNGKESKKSLNDLFKKAEISKLGLKDILKEGGVN